MSVTLYVDIRGERSREFDDPAQHAEVLADHVRGFTRGIGLALRSKEDRDKGFWPGGMDSTRVTWAGDVIRLSAWWNDRDKARKAARELTDFLLANGWRDSLMNVFIAHRDGTKGGFTEAFHGEAISLYSLVKKLEN